MMLQPHSVYPSDRPEPGDIGPARPDYEKPKGVPDQRGAILDEHTDFSQTGLP